MNCILKKSPARSHTHGLILTSEQILRTQGFETEILHPVDFDIAHSVDPQQKAMDDWKLLYNKIMDAQILVIGTPIWLGEKSSVTVELLEHLYAHSAETIHLGHNGIFLMLLLLLVQD